MSKIGKRRRVTFITNIVLIGVTMVVGLICFLPTRAVTASKTSPYYKGGTDGDKISLMFNVYEGEDVVNGILDVLESYGVKATFFMGGCFADDHRELLERMVAEGHEVANHGYFHLDHSKISYEKNVEEIANTGKVIESLCGAKPALFAPPSGAYNDTTLKAAASLGYTVVMWSKDTIDWRDSDEKLIVKRATDGAEPGDLVLMHPKKHTLSALPKILDHYKNIGLKQSTVSANLFGEN